MWLCGLHTKEGPDAGGAGQGCCHYGSLCSSSLAGGVPLSPAPEGRSGAHSTRLGGHNEGGRFRALLGSQFGKKRVVGIPSMQGIGGAYGSTMSGVHRRDIECAANVKPEIITDITLRYIEMHDTIATRIWDQNMFFLVIPLQYRKTAS